MQADQLYLSGTGVSGRCAKFADEFGPFKENNIFFNDDLIEYSIESCTLPTNSFEDFLDLSSIYFEPIWLGEDAFNHDEHAYSTLSKKTYSKSPFAPESLINDHSPLGRTNLSPSSDNRVPYLCGEETRKNVDGVDLCSEAIGIGNNEYIDSVDLCAEKITISNEENANLEGVKDIVVESDFKEIFEEKNLKFFPMGNVTADCFNHEEVQDLFGHNKNENPLAAEARVNLGYLFESNCFLTDEDLIDWMDLDGDLGPLFNDLDDWFTDDDKEIDIIHDDDGDVCSESSLSNGSISLTNREVSEKVQGNQRESIMHKSFIGRKRKRNFKNITSNEDDNDNDADWTQDLRASTRKSSLPKKKKVPTATLR